MGFLLLSEVSCRRWTFSVDARHLHVEKGLERFDKVRLSMGYG